MIRAIVIDDVSTVRIALKRILTEEGDIQIVAEGRNGKDAVTLTQKLRPDIVLMDVDMPQKDGLEATREIMAQSATPILIVTSSSVYDARGMPFSAIESGALDVFSKPSIAGTDSWQTVGMNLRRAVRTLSQVKVISRRRPPRSSRTVPAHPDPRPKQEPEAPVRAPRETRPRVKPGDEPRLIAVGASTGGPMVVRQILQALPETFSIPMVLVQHIGDEFVAGLVEWLDKNSPVHVVLAKEGATLLPRQLAVAPGGIHIRVTDGLTIRYDDGPMLHHCKPAVDVMFHSVARTVGAEAAAILLTGMGRDGADGLKAIRTAGGITIAQDEASSTVYGMPAAAVELGAAKYVLPPPAIGHWLSKLTQDRQEAQ